MDYKKRLEGNNEHLYDLNPANKIMRLNMDNKNECLMRYVFSKTLMPLYGVPCLVSVVILIYVVLSY